MCVFSCLEAYLEKTAPLRHETDQLFVSYVKPYKAISRATITRWVKATLLSAGINVNVYKAHSTRAASANAALEKSADLECVLRTAGWDSENTFCKYYKRSTVKTSSYADNVLSFA